MEKYKSKFEEEKKELKESVYDIILYYFHDLNKYDKFSIERAVKNMEIKDVNNLKDGLDKLFYNLEG